MNTCILIGTVAWLHLTNGSGTELYINVDNIAHISWAGWVDSNGRYSVPIQAWSESEDRYLLGKEIMDMIRECE